MGRRSEPRIAIPFTVIVRGTDAKGTPFAVTAETIDISVSGARLKGLDGMALLAKRVEITYKNQTAWYRVQWVGQLGSADAGMVGVRCLEGKYIWGVKPKEWEPDSYDPTRPGMQVQNPAASNQAGIGPWGGANRRRFPRQAVRMETQIFTNASSGAISGKITDISLGGCYIELFSPLPVSTPIELETALDDVALRLPGKVISSQAGFGMGIEFGALTPLEFEKLRSIAPPVSEVSEPVRALSRPASAPPKPAGSPVGQQSPSAEWNYGQSATTAETLEAIVRVLFNKGLITRAEIAEEIEKLRASKMAALR